MFPIQHTAFIFYANGTLWRYNIHYKMRRPMHLNAQANEFFPSVKFIFPSVTFKSSFIEIQLTYKNKLHICVQFIIYITVYI